MMKMMKKKRPDRSELGGIHLPGKEGFIFQVQKGSKFRPNWIQWGFEKPNMQILDVLLFVIQMDLNFGHGFV